MKDPAAISRVFVFVMAAVELPGPLGDRTLPTAEVMGAQAQHPNHSYRAASRSV
jgi:hypothetical protein